MCQTVTDELTLNEERGPLFREEQMSNMIKMGNDEFILYIRKQHKTCKKGTKHLGREIWKWLRRHGGEKVHPDPMHCMWHSEPSQLAFVTEDRLPNDATQFIFDRSLLPALYDRLDELGSC